MSKKYFLVIFSLAILFGCEENKECSGIQNGQYSGYGVIFYHKPVSGRLYEVTIIPVCNDSTKLIERVRRGDQKLQKIDGISSNLAIGSPFFKEVFETSQRIKLLTDTNLASQYREIYICPVFISFDGVQNDTKSITGMNENILSESLLFSNGNKFTLRYFFTNQLNIKSIRVK